MQQEAAMQLALTPEEAAFRDELRNFYRTEIPAEIRERTRAGAESQPRRRRHQQQDPQRPRARGAQLAGRMGW